MLSCASFDALQAIKGLQSPAMADEMDLDPQLRDYLDKANMLKSMENVSELPVQQLRQMYEKLYRWSHCPHMQKLLMMFMAPR